MEWCRDRVFYVVIECGLDQRIGRVATKLAMPGVFCSDIMFLCSDRVSNGVEALCRNRIFDVTTEYGQIERFCVATEKFYVAT